MFDLFNDIAFVVFDGLCLMPLCLITFDVFGKFVFDVFDDMALSVLCLMTLMTFFDDCGDLCLMIVSDVFDEMAFARFDDIVFDICFNLLCMIGITFDLSLFSSQNIISRFFSY